MKIDKVKKRNGKITYFNKSKIKDAIKKILISNR